MNGKKRLGFDCFCSKAEGWEAVRGAPIARFGRLNRLAARIALFSGAVLLLAFLVTAAPAPASAQVSVSVGISVGFPPPALPVYVQPICPGPGYIWTPGYWAWDPDFGYYWVPGTWVLAPYPGLLWTPGYWGWYGGAYVWYEGYWGPVVGFYGGINYGFGYNGYGYYGGYWSNNVFYYNRTVNNISVTDIRNVYSRPIPRSATPGRVSFNGGRGGAQLRPTVAQREARQTGRPPAAMQREHFQAARRDPALRASVNHGRPAIAATPRPGVFKGPGVERATRAGAPYKAPPQGRTGAPGTREKGVRPGGPERRQPGVAPRHEAPAAPGARPAPRGGAERPAYRQVEPGREQAPRQVRPPAEQRFQREMPRQAPPREVPRVAPQREAPPRMAPPQERIAPPREAPGGAPQQPRERREEGGR